MLIAVIGGSSCTQDVARNAEEVGRELAKRGVALVCGGLGGVMEAASRGAKAEGGTTIGILPGKSRREANPYIDIPIVTGIGLARNSIVANSGEAAIAIDGSFGTLSEIAFALQMGIPVVGLDTWALSLKGKEDKSIIIASNPVDAVEKAIAAARDNERRS